MRRLGARGRDRRRLGVITAGLHLDGLIDTFDVVISWRSRERKLEIMSFAEHI